MQQFRLNQQDVQEGGGQSGRDGLDEERERFANSHGWDTLYDLLDCMLDKRNHNRKQCNGNPEGTD